MQFAPCDGHKNRLGSKPGDESALASLETGSALLPPHESEANVFEVIPAWKSAGTFVRARHGSIGSQAAQQGRATAAKKVVDCGEGATTTVAAEEEEATGAGATGAGATAATAAAKRLEG